tara:strand:- start:149 stop:1012 length:864 start_codon:yes stop_codon:yes gene_type:complete
MPQVNNTGNLENAQNIILASARFTEEHNAPAVALVEKFSLSKGAKQVTVPKVSQMSMSDLTDGQDIVDEEEIGMSTTDLTAAEVGAKIIITDKLLRQANDNVFKIVGRQLGDGMARKKDGDVLDLYDSFSTDLGGNGNLTTALLGACIATAKANKYGNDLYFIHHPNAIYRLASDAISGIATSGIPDGYSADLLKNFWSGLKPLNNVPVFEDGNLTDNIDANNDAKGFIGAKEAIAYLESVNQNVERQRDASLRATEIVMTSDYGVFVLDDARGAAASYDIADLATI